MADFESDGGEFFSYSRQVGEDFVVQTNVHLEGSGSITTWVPSGRWELDRDKIEHDAREVEDGSVPRWDCTWVRTKGFGVGELNSLSTILPGGRQVLYYIHAQPGYQRRVSDKLSPEEEALVAKMPTALDQSLTELLGHTIPWTIDFETTMRDVLKWSELPEFAAEAVRLNVLSNPFVETEDDWDYKYRCPVYESTLLFKEAGSQVRCLCGHKDHRSKFETAKKLAEIM